MRIRRRVAVVTLAIAGAVFCGEYLAQDGSVGIRTNVAAVAATRPLLAGVADHWRVSRVALVRGSHLFETIAGVPSGGLGRRGFPGPVWVVLVSVNSGGGQVLNLALGHFGIGPVETRSFKT